MLDLKNAKALTLAQQKKYDRILTNWGAMNAEVRKLTRTEVGEALVFELRGRHRLTVLQRLVARYGVLEQQENEAELARALTQQLEAER